MPHRPGRPQASCQTPPAARSPSLQAPETEWPRRRPPGFSAGFSERSLPTCSERRKTPFPQGPTTPLGRAGAAPRPSTPASGRGLREPQVSCSRPSPQLRRASALSRGPDPEAAFLVSAAFESSRDGRRSGAQARDAAAALEPAAYSRKGSPRGGFHRTVHTPREIPHRATHKPQFFCKFPLPALNRRYAARAAGPLRQTSSVPGSQPTAAFPLPEETPPPRPKGTRKPSATSASSAEGGAARAPPDRARLFRARPLRTGTGGAGWLPAASPQSAAAGAACGPGGWEKRSVGE